MLALSLFLALPSLAHATITQSNCSTLSVAGETYELNQSVSISGMLANCFTVASANVTLDCRGFSITGSNDLFSYGIYSNQSGTLVRNCNVSNFLYGIYFDSAGNGTIQNTTSGSSGATSSYVGIFIFSSPDAIIANSTGFGIGGIGILLQNSIRSTVINSNGTSTSHAGIRLSNSSNAAISAVTATSSSVSSMDLYTGSNNNVIANSTATTGAYPGVYLSSSSNNTFTSCQIAGKDSTNGAFSLQQNSTNNTIANSTINGKAGKYAIFFPQASGIKNNGNLFINNTILNASTLVYIGNTNANNTFCLNNFTNIGNLSTSAPEYYVNDVMGVNFYNFYNCTYAGLNQGNVWANVLNGSVNVTGATSSSIPALYIGTNGSGYPYNSTTSIGKVSTGVVDRAPLTDVNPFRPWISAISFFPSSPNVSSNLTCNATALDNSYASLNITVAWQKNGVEFSSAIYAATNATPLLANLSLNSSITEGGDAWSCSAWANNSIAASLVNFSANASISVTCANLSTANWVYTMSSNASINGSTCFNVAAANITLDCAGFTISGNGTAGTYGIYSNQPNTTVRNCAVSRFDTDIIISGTVRANVTNVTLGTPIGLLVNSTTDSSFSQIYIDNSTIYGIYVTNYSHRNSFTGISINASSGHGIYVFLGSNLTFDCAGGLLNGSNAAGTYGIYTWQLNTTIRNCAIANFANAIRLANGATDGAISNIDASSSVDSGDVISLNSARSTTFTNVTAASLANGYGFYLQGAVNNTFLDCAGSSASNPGVYIITSISANNTFTNFTAFSVSNAGLNLNSAGPNNFTHLNASSISSMAIAISGTSANIFSNSSFTSNGSVVASIWGSSSLVFANSTFISSNRAGTLLYLDSSTSGNTFYWNNFTNTSGLYVNDTNGSNFYNTTIGSHGEGNIWANVMNSSVRVVGSPTSSIPGLYAGVLGNGVPYNSTSSLAKISSGVVDYAPLTSINKTAPRVSPISISPPSPDVTSNLSCNITALDDDVSSLNITYAWQKNGAEFSSATLPASNATPLLANLSLNSSITQAGDNWSCSAWANNSYSVSPANFSLNVTIPAICSNHSSPNMVYTMSSNASINGSTCFNVTAENVTLDCAGFSIVGNGSAGTYGVYSNQFNTTVRNCNISNFGIGVGFEGNNGTIQNTTSSSRIAISISGNYCTITDSSAFCSYSLGYAAIVSGSYNTMANLTVTADLGMFGIYLSGDHHTIANSSVYLNATISLFGALYMNSAEYISISNTNISGNQRTIFMESSNHNSFTDVSINSSSYGIFINTSNNNTFTNVSGIATHAASYGIFTTGASNGTSFIGTAIRHPTRAPFYLSGYGSNTLVDCQGLQISNSSSTGAIYSDNINTTIRNCIFSNFSTTINLNGASNGTISNNTFILPSSQAIYVSGGGNLFYWNNFTGTPPLYINDTNGSNYYNTTISGHGEGNIYANVLDGHADVAGLNLSAGFPSLYYGTFGRNYPYNSSTSLGKVTSGVVDYAPLTDINTSRPWISTISLSPLAPTLPSNITCNITAMDDAFTNLNITYEWQKNGAPFSNGTLPATNATFLLVNLSLNSSITQAGDNWSCSAWANNSVSISIANFSSNITVAAQPDNITLLLNGTEANFTASYGTSLTANASSTSNTHALYLNGSLIASDYAATLAAGYWNFTANSSGNENYTAAASTYFATISKASSAANISAGSWSISAGQNATINCSINNLQSNLTLYQNGTLLNYSAGNFSTFITSLAAGSYNFTCNASSSENYTAAEASAILSVGQVADTITLLLNGTEANFTASYGTSLTANASSTSNTHALYLNGSLIASDYAATLAAGYWNFTANSSGNENYTAAASTYFANITKAASSLSLETNSPASAGSPANVTCNISNAQIQIFLYRNNTLVNSSTGAAITDTAVLAAGIYNYTCNSTASENYTAATGASSILLVGKLADSITLLLNSQASNITLSYNQSLSVTASSLSGTEQLYQDGLPIGNLSNAILIAGYYNFTANSSGNVNYTNASKSYFANITALSSSLTLSAVSWSISFGTQANVTCSVGNSQTPIFLYRDGALLNSSTGNFANYIESLPVGTHNYTCNSTASQNYTAAAEQNSSLTVSKLADPITLLLNSYSADISLSYGQPLNATASSASNAHQLYQDGSPIGNLTNATLAVGYYNFTANSSGNENYTGGSATYYANISKASSSLTLSAASWSVPFGTQANVTCSVGNSQTPIFLYRDGALLNSSTGNSANYIESLPVGTHNYTCNSTASQNYSAAPEQNHALLVSILPDAITLLLNSYASNISISYGQPLTVTASSLSNAHQLYQDGSPIGNLTNATLAVGYYNFTASSPDSENYTGDSATYFAIIAALPSTLSLSATSWSVPFGTQANVTCSVGNSQTPIFLYRDGALLNSSTGNSANYIESLPVGTHNYTCNSTVSQNYTAATPASNTLTVSELPDIISLLLNGISSNLAIIYGNALNITADSLSGTHLLYRNETPEANPFLGPIAAGYYNYTANSSGNENYTSGRKTYFLTMLQNSSSNITLSGTNWNPQFGASITLNCSVNNNQSPIFLYINGTLANQSTGDYNLYTFTPGVGTQNVTCNATDSENYTAPDAVSYNLIVDPAESTVSLLLNWVASDISLTYGQSLNATASSASGTHQLYLDDSPVSNPHIATLAAGYYNFTANTTANENYTYETVSYMANISQAGSALSLSATSWTVAPGTRVNVSCGVGNSQTPISLYRNGTLLNSSTGGWANYSDMPSVGAYFYTCNSTDSQNYTAAPELNNTLEVNIMPDAINLTLNGAQANLSIDYGAALSAAVSSLSGTHTLYLNGSPVSNPYSSPLTAGFYNFTANSSGNENYTGAAKSYFATISKASSAITLSAASWSISAGEQASVNCSVGNSQTPITLYLEGANVSYSQGSSLLYAANLSAGAYNFTCNSTESENYTAAPQQSSILAVQQISDSIALLLNGVASNITLTYGNSLGVSVSSSSGTHQLYQDGVATGNISSTVFAAGFYNFTANSSGNENYTASSKAYFANITQAPSSLSLSAPSWAISLGSQSNVTCTVGNSQTPIYLYRNWAQVNSSTGGTISFIDSPGAGTYNYTCNSTASQNYTAAAAASELLTVGQTSDAITLLLNGTEADFSAAYSPSFTLTVNASSSSGTHGLYLNGSLVASNYASVLAAGAYNFTANSSGNENYTASSKTYTASISKAASALSLNATSWSISTGTESSVNCSMDNAQTAFSLYRGATLVGTSTGSTISDMQNLSAGTYNYTCNSSASENYTSAPDQSQLLRVVSAIPSIVSAYASPNLTTNSSNVSLYINATEAESLWANITLPDGSTAQVALSNGANTTYAGTTLPGRYNITFHANNSLGNASSAGWFESYSPIIFNATLIGHNLSGMNGSFSAYYAGTLVATNSSPNGTFTQQLPDGLLDLLFSAYSGRISALLRSVNASADNSRTFGMDRNSSLPGYLTSYGINNSYNFTNATVSIYYDDASYASEPALHLYKCDNYTFGSLICDGSWSDVTSNATQDTSGHYFSIMVYSFSGFAVQQASYCGDGVCGSGKSCSSCPADCGICPSGSGGGGGGGGGGSSSASSKQSSTFQVDLGYGKYCPVQITREIQSTTNLSVMTTTLENIGNESCKMESFTFSDTIPAVFSAMDDLTFVPMYDSREGSSINFTFPSFSNGESKTFTYSAKTWIPPSRAKNFTTYGMSAKKQPAPASEPQRPETPQEQPTDEPSVQPSAKPPTTLPSKQPGQAPAEPKTVFYGKPDTALPFAFIALSLATAGAILVYYFTRRAGEKQGPPSQP